VCRKPIQLEAAPLLAGLPILSPHDSVMSVLMQERGLLDRLTVLAGRLGMAALLTVYVV